jgi:hypothetical protein
MDYLVEFGGRTAELDCHRDGLIVTSAGSGALNLGSPEHRLLSFSG